MNHIIYNVHLASPVYKPSHR